jgi:NAD(P)-dependent dehydrogenase (short-subunit alcohol dehydrogenase family)
MSVNLKGTWLASRAVVPVMTGGGGGAIVHVASNMGMRGVANQVAYSASKGGVIALTRSMAIDLGSVGIRVNCVNPGHVSTPMGDGAALQLGLTEETVGLKYPIGRIGVPEEQAAAISFLASDEAAFVTGAIVAVDGGYTA